MKEAAIVVSSFPLILYSKLPPSTRNGLGEKLWWWGLKDKLVDSVEDGNYASYLFCEHWYFDPSQPFFIQFIIAPAQSSLSPVQQPSEFPLNSEETSSELFTRQTTTAASPSL